MSQRWNIHFRSRAEWSDDDVDRLRAGVRVWAAHARAVLAEPFHGLGDVEYEVGELVRSETGLEEDLGGGATTTWRKVLGPASAPPDSTWSVCAWAGSVMLPVTHGVAEP